MILSDKTIKKLLKDKELVIKDLSEDAIQPGSIDLTLDDSALILKYWKTDGVLDFDSPVEHEKVSGEKLIIPPQGFILATTKEYMELPNNVSGFVEGRSSIGRMGLFIQNASVVNPGFKGKLTLELYNANSLPIRVSTGHRICQLILCKMDQASQSGYKGKYQNQNETVSSRIYLDKKT